MDRERFDTLTRLLATTGSRRTALGAVLGSAVLGHGRDALAKKKGKKKRKKTRAEAAPPGCYTGTRCEIGRLKNAANCNFEGSTAFAGKDLWKSNLSNTHLRGITATGASFMDANLSNACLVDADLTGANLTRANLGNAILCRTMLPNGSIENKGCALGTACCPTCIGLGQACGGDLGGSCCGGAVCTGGPGTPGACAVACTEPFTDTSCDCYSTLIDRVPFCSAFFDGTCSRANPSCPAGSTCTFNPCGDSTGETGVCGLPCAFPEDCACTADNVATVCDAADPFIKCGDCCGPVARAALRAAGEPQPQPQPKPSGS